MTPFVPNLPIKLPLLPQRLVHVLFPVVMLAGAVGWGPSVLMENGVYLPRWAWLHLAVGIAKIVYLLGASFGIISHGALRNVFPVQPLPPEEMVLPKLPPAVIVPPYPPQ